ncbi:MAG: RHS repeat-associated core domain-containing protein, partial [Pirellulales bacterium]|nr:RHS repeat-associated core domain-containing protein [Pirellulales bacterium]
MFSAWGQIVEDTNPDFVFPFAFTGREYDVETGLYYYRARYYDPHTGRFLSEDPLGFSAGDTNLRRYVHNSVTVFVDPYGLKEGPGFFQLYLHYLKPSNNDGFGDGWGYAKWAGWILFVGATSWLIGIYASSALAIAKGAALKTVVSLEPMSSEQALELLKGLDNTVVLIAPRPTLRGRLTQDREFLLRALRVLVCEELLKQQTKRQTEVRRLRQR